MTFDAIRQLRLDQLPSLAERARLENNIQCQHGIIDLCLRPILLETNPALPTFEPWEEQVVLCVGSYLGRWIRTLLIARTGFGKSLIFHAYA